ncbi:MAG: hypothetical protein NWS97_10090 [Limnohabitans sp.]|nr:hypothetical protein [Limnohabitans sp.]MDP4771563.1 hypothetical protein [Limnohabitans sp.]
MITGAETAHLNPKIPTIYLEGRLPLVIERTAADLGLRDGQVIQATAEARLDRLRLNLQDPAQAGRFIDLPKELPAGLRLASGDTALFRVQLQSDGSIWLRPLQATPAATPTTAAPLAQLPNRMQQLGFRPPDMGALAMLLRPGGLDSLLQGLSSASPELAALQQWQRLRPSMAQLTPEKLQQLMQRSGLMTEAFLAQGLGGGLVDLKTGLRQLLRLLQNTSHEAAGRVQDAIDDIESRQLTAAETVTGREWVLSMMLPFSDAEPVTLRFVRSRRPPGEEKAPLVIHLHTRNRDLGEVWLQTRISDETEVDMVMWALREDVVKRARDMTPNLAEELDSAGLNMTRLLVIHGPGPSEPLPWNPPETGSLLDVQT